MSNSNDNNNNTKIKNMEIRKETKILIISHGYKQSLIAGGPPQDIRDFLLQKIELLDYLILPFPHADYDQPLLHLYRNGVMTQTITGLRNRGPEWLQYFMHLFVIFSLLIRRKTTYDVCFSLDNLSVLPIVPLRTLGIVKKIVYYAIDYSPKRFPGRILNAFYNIGDRLACFFADTHWVLAQGIVNAKTARGFLTNKPPLFQEVPMGFRRREIQLQPIEHIDQFHFVFVGILLKKQGLQIVLNAFPKLMTIFPKAHLTIIGTGEYERTLRNMIHGQMLNQMIRFLGFVENHRTIEQILTHAGVGLAPYLPEPGNFSYYTDPGKIKLYLGCGLPIITTDVPAIARVLEKKNAGIIMDASEQGFLQAASYLLHNQERYKTFRDAAISFAKDFDYENILGKAIQNM